MTESDLPTPPASIVATETTSWKELEGRITSADYLEAVVDSYLSFYASGAGHTAKAKRYDLTHFLKFLAKGTPIEKVPLSSWTPSSTRDFIEECLRRGESPATVGRRLATLKHLGRALAERNPGFIHPAREVKAPKLPVTKPQGLLPNEVALLRELSQRRLSDPKKLTFRLIRDVCLCELLLATGLRADEVRLLTLGQLAEDRAWLKNVKTKGRQYRKVYVESGVREVIEQYLKERDMELRAAFPLYAEVPAKERLRYPLFIGLRGATLAQPESFGLAPKTVWRIIHELGREAGNHADVTLPRLHPHKLRHTFAHGLLDSSKDLRLVAQALGHGDVRTTMRYTERTEEEVARAIESSKKPTK